MDIPKHERSAMAMFRCGVLPLRVETGRYKGEPLADRMCTVCENNEIETEKHFYYNVLYMKILEMIYLECLEFVIPLLLMITCL
jgi:hypothetical protein